MEGSLLNLSTVRPVAFFAWNAQSFAERWIRRGAVFVQALLRPLLYTTNRVFATRVGNAILRDISRDRLDLLGEEYFHYHLQPKLKPAGVQALREALARGERVVLVSQGLDHIMRPLARYLGVEELICNRLEFRDGYATGRLLEPVIRPRGALALITGRGSDGRRELQQLSRELNCPPQKLLAAVVPAQREVKAPERTLVRFNSVSAPERLSVRQALAGKHLLLIGVTGFIGKVWLAHILQDLPEIGRIYLLVRCQKSTSGAQRFRKLVEESPVFDRLQGRLAAQFPEYLSRRVQVLEGDASQPGLGLEPAIAARLQASLDVVINSSGLTDFNPDLRDALAGNVDAVSNVLEFVRGCDHAGLLHLSTCYVAGARDGRISEQAQPDYTPLGASGFDAEREIENLRQLIVDAVARSESSELGDELRRQSLEKKANGNGLSPAALENQVRKNRIRWLRTTLTDAGTKRAQELGWPNTYTFTKSLAESLLLKRGDGRAIAIVRPAIVETSLTRPFLGWNEGINTSASLSYLLGTYFRQLPSNARKNLDIIPVDTVCRGMTLIAAAIVQRCHQPLYQLATSVTNPCDMGRSIELTCLAHRKFYRAQNGLHHQLRMRFDTIPVSKERYQRLSAPAQKAVIKSLQRLTAPFPFLQPPLVRTERGLEKVEKLIELFEPFILHNEQDFEAEHIEWLAQALPDDERGVFGYDTRSLDWWEYWINIHIPALRKWTYPLIEGRPVEAGPRRSFDLPPSRGDMAGPGCSPAGSISTGTTGATWQYS
ncbi:MAG TPA: SDR family oxidoreductase [Terriglobales bacterium]|nr:SDR family oxidoreductase [Terriglobales bacterium]